MLELCSSSFFWENPIFDNTIWTPLMNGLRIGLSLGGALFFLYESRARRLGKPLSESVRRCVMLAMTLLAFGAYFDFFNPSTRYSEYYHRGEVYHHYLGAKYSRELGYTRIYECTAVAEVELGRGDEVRKRDYRDLRDNMIRPVAVGYVLSDPSRCKKHFTLATWNAFKKDINWFWSVGRGSYWENSQKDYGFNAPPVWIMTAKLFTSLHPAGDAFFKLLAGIDIVLQIGLLLLMFWAFGQRVGTVATVFWGSNAASNFYWTGGAFLRQDWMFLLVASLCLARKRHFFLAGAALTGASLLRAVPAIFFLGWAIVILLRAIRRYRVHPDHRRLLAGAAIAFSTLVPASVVVTGPDSYPAFFERMSVYQKTPLTDDMGLGTMLSHDWTGRMRFARDDDLEDPFQTWKAGRNARKHQLRFVRYGIVALLFAWTVWALRKTKLLWIAEALALPLVMALTDLANYYYSFFILAAALVKVRAGLGPVVLVTAGASQILLLSYYWIDDKFVAQSWLFAVFSLVLLAALSRRRFRVDA
jgi:hypothetical protein